MNDPCFDNDYAKEKYEVVYFLLRFYKSNEPGFLCDVNKRQKYIVP